MVTNKKFTLPHPNNLTLNFQKKFTTPLTPPPQKKNFNSQKSIPLPPKKNKPPESP